MAKIIIDIPQEILDKNNGNLHFKVGIVNGFVDYVGTNEYNFHNAVIPDNATNLYVMKSVFPNYAYHNDDNNIRMLDGFMLIKLDKEWCNKPYEVKENDD